MAKKPTSVESIRSLLREARFPINSFRGAAESYRAESVFSDELLAGLAQPTPTVSFQLSDALAVVANQLVAIEDAVDNLESIAAPLDTLAQSVAEIVKKAIMQMRWDSSFYDLQFGDAVITAVKSETSLGADWPFFDLFVRGLLPVTADYTKYLNSLLDAEGFDTTHDVKARRKASYKRLHPGPPSSSEIATAMERTKFINRLVQRHWIDYYESIGESDLRGSIDQSKNLYFAVHASIEDTLFGLGLRESRIESGIIPVVQSPPTRFKGVWEVDEKDEWVEQRPSNFAHGPNRRPPSPKTLKEAVKQMDNPQPWVVEFELDFGVHP